MLLDSLLKSSEMANAILDNYKEKEDLLDLELVFSDLKIPFFYNSLNDYKNSLGFFTNVGGIGILIQKNISKTNKRVIMALILGIYVYSKVVIPNEHFKFILYEDESFTLLDNAKNKKDCLYFAEKFATDLLLPKEKFEKEYDKLENINEYEIEHLSKIFKVNKKAIIYKLHIM